MHIMSTKSESIADSGEWRSPGNRPSEYALRSKVCCDCRPPLSDPEFYEPHARAVGLELGFNGASIDANRNTKLGDGLLGCSAGGIQDNPIPVPRLVVPVEYLLPGGQNQSRNIHIARSSTTLMLRRI